MIPFPPARDERRSPQAVRAAREALGWTQERLADEMGVLPVEAAAWESGAVAIPRREADVLQWRIELAAYESRMPRRDCGWMHANADRLWRMDALGPHHAALAEGELGAHQRGCAECARVLRARQADPPPDPPAPPGVLGGLSGLRRRIARMPAWLRLPLQAVDMALALTPGYLLVNLVLLVQGSEGVPVSPGWFVLLAAGMTWLAYLCNATLASRARRPFRAGMAIAAGVAVPGAAVLALLGRASLSGLGTWAVVGLVTVFGGMLLGSGDDEARYREEDLLEAEERVTGTDGQAPSSRVPSP